MFEKPVEEHRWLEQLVGNWSFESEGYMGPDQPPMTSRGEVTCRTLGGLWSIIETESDSPSGERWQSIMTLGYEAQSKRFVGSFIASMMTYFWTYSGQLDEARTKLVLDAIGPNMGGDGMARYHDTVQLIDADHWTLSSEVELPDGKWQHFMTAHYRRVK